MYLLRKIVPLFFLLSSLAFHSVKKEKPVGEEPITHSFFMAGPDFTGIISEKGEEVWNAGKAGARDGYVLPNGHILICWADEVKEFNTKKEVVFVYPRQSEEMELGTAVRLENGNTLIVESGTTPQIVETDRTGKVVTATPLQPDTDNTHMQTRMARKLENGNYLVPHLLAFAVKEYDAKGKVVNIFRTDLEELGGRQAENWPFAAIRLSNGNTLTTLTHGNKIIEFNSAGEIVWKVTNDDIPGHPFQDPCGAQRLPNGNTVIASYGAKEETIKLFEISRDKQLVWTYSGYNVHHFQVLTTNGSPVTGAPLK